MNSFLICVVSYLIELHSLTAGFPSSSSSVKLSITLSPTGQDAEWFEAQTSTDSATLVVSAVEVLATLETGPADLHCGSGYFGSRGGAAHPCLAAAGGQSKGPCAAVVCCRLVHAAEYPCVPVWAGPAPHKLHTAKLAEAHHQVQWRGGSGVVKSV